MFKKERYRIGWFYRLPVDGEILDVTLINKSGKRATVLIQNRSIDMSLHGFTGRKKMYSQAVPIRTVRLSELMPITPSRTPRGLIGWFRSKIRL